LIQILIFHHLQGQQTIMKKILIIEDDQKIAFALCVRLKAHGYATWTAGDAIAALNQARRHKPDLILLDISLPGGNGLALAEHLRSLRETHDTPIIFATASKDPKLRAKAIQLGASGLLRKPYDPEALLAVIEHALMGTCGRINPFEFEKNEQRSMPRKILIVEDDEKLAKALALRINAAGFETSIANDGISGVRSAVKNRPDAVVLDISLPAGDGFAVAERIQANIPDPMPIIFLTASKRADFRQRAQDLGAVAFFEKPYEAEALLATIREVTE
jgi:DNA-binding response OmpR family regulator